jgi:hypothetical protein
MLLFFGRCQWKMKFARSTKRRLDVTSLDDEKTVL